jgi:hypothetical protein
MSRGLSFSWWRSTVFLCICNWRIKPTFVELWHDNAFHGFWLTPASRTNRSAFHNIDDETVLTPSQYQNNTELLGASETRWTDIGFKQITSGHNILYSGRTDGHHSSVNYNIKKDAQVYYNGNLSLTDSLKRHTALCLPYVWSCILCSNIGTPKTRKRVIFYIYDKLQQVVVKPRDIIATHNRGHIAHMSHVG